MRQIDQQSGAGSTPVSSIPMSSDRTAELPQPPMLQQQHEQHLQLQQQHHQQHQQQQHQSQQQPLPQHHHHQHSLSFPAAADTAGSSLGLTLPGAAYVETQQYAYSPTYDTSSYPGIIHSAGAGSHSNTSLPLPSSSTAQSLTSLTSLASLSSEGTTNELDGEHQPAQVVGSQGRRGVVPHEPGYADVVTMEEFMAMTHEKDADGKYPCPSCSKKYQNAKHLTRHYYTHCDERPYHCRLCGTIFARSDVLKRHFDKCARRREIPESQRGSHLQHTPGYTKKHGRLRKEHSHSDDLKKRAAQGLTPILRSNHTRDNSAVTDGSYVSPNHTANSSRRHSLSGYDDLQPSPVSYTSGHLDQLNITYPQPGSQLGIPSPYAPTATSPLATHFEPARQDGSVDSLQPNQGYYGAPQQQQWTFASTAPMEPASVSAYYAYAPPQPAWQPHQQSYHQQHPSQQ